MKYAAYAAIITYTLWVFYLAVMNLARDAALEARLEALEAK